MWLLRGLVKALVLAPSTLDAHASELNGAFVCVDLATSAVAVLSKERSYMLSQMWVIISVAAAARALCIADVLMLRTS